MTQPLNEAERRRHRRRNLAQSAVLLGGMIVLLSFCGWIVAGVEGVVWTLLASGLSLVLSPRISPRLILRMYGARPISPLELPVLFDLLARISKRAGLQRSPDLYYVPSPMLNAFTLGSREEAAIAVTDGLLRHLNRRELVGVLAHEVSHIRNNDLWIMSLADAISRLTGIMSIFGVLLLFGSLPLLLAGAGGVPWLLATLLMFAPTIGSLLQLALSRTREFDADIDAAGITGDPRGLAAALAKLERFQGGFMESVFLPGRRIPDPSLLRTHPSTEERVHRLLSLEQRPDPIDEEIRPMAMPAQFMPRRSSPNWHLTGLWH